MKVDYNTTLNEWLSEWKGGYSTRDLWYDWFCSDRSLDKRADKMLKVADRISKCNKSIGKNYNVWLKNNCSGSWNLYDDIRFEPLINGVRGEDDIRNDMYFLVAYKPPRAVEKGMLYELFDLEKLDYCRKNNLNTDDAYTYYKNVYDLTKAVDALVKDKMARHGYFN